MLCITLFSTDTVACSSLIPNNDRVANYESLLAYDQTTEAIKFDEDQTESHLFLCTTPVSYDLIKRGNEQEKSEQIHQLMRGVARDQREIRSLTNEALAQENHDLSNPSTTAFDLELKNKKLASQFLNKHKLTYIKQVEAFRFIVNLLAEYFVDLQNLSSKATVKAQLNDILTFMDTKKGDMQSFIKEIENYVKDKDQAQQSLIDVNVNTKQAKRSLGASGLKAMWMTAFPHVFLIFKEEVQKLLNIIKQTPFDLKKYRDHLNTVYRELQEIMVGFDNYDETIKINR